MTMMIQIKKEQMFFGFISFFIGNFVESETRLFDTLEFGKRTIWNKGVIYGGFERYSGTVNDFFFKINNSY